MMIWAIDQASTSGWCFGDTRSPRNLRVGETRTHADRADVVRSLHIAVKHLQLSGGGPLRIVFEDHSDFYFGHGNSSVPGLLGLGRAQGEWSEAILGALSPESWHSVTPKVWRKAVLGLPGNVDSARAKAEAVRWARAWLKRDDIGPDAAEAVAIWAWASNNLVAVMAAEAIAREAARVRANEKAKERRAAKRKGTS